MDEGGTISKLSRKDLRKQKLMEYLAAKGKLKQPNLKPYLRDDYLAKKSILSTTQPASGKENQPSNVVMKNGATKKGTAAKQILQPTGEVHGAVKQSLQKGGITSAAQRTSHPAAPTVKTQLLSLNRNALSTRTYTIASLKASCGSTNQPQKLSKTLTKPAVPSSAVKSLSSTDPSSVTQPVRHTNRKNPGNKVIANSIGKTCVGARLGPIVNTKTHHLSAVGQPSNIKSNPAICHSAVTLTSTANNTSRVRSNFAPCVSVAKTTDKAQGKTNGSTALHKPFQFRANQSTALHKPFQCRANQSTALHKPFQCRANQRTGLHKPFQCRATSPGTSSTGSGNQPRLQANTKPLSVKPLELPRQSPPSVAGKQTVISARAITATVKSDLTKKVGKTTGTVVQPAKNTAETNRKHQISEDKKAGNNQAARVGYVVPAATKRQCSSKGAEPGVKVNIPNGKENKKADKAKKGPLPCAGTKRSGIPSVSQTLPRYIRNVEKTTTLLGCRVPQTEGKRSTAAQEERTRKLHEWREAKGISYKRPPMPVKPRVRRTVALPQPYWANMEAEDEAHSLISSVDRSLADCIKLLAEGCPPERVAEILSRLPPIAKRFAKYWICQARLMERQGNLDVLPMFEEAVRLVLEPVDDLRTVVFDILKKRDENECAANANEEEEHLLGGSPMGADPLVTPMPVRVLIQGDKGYSSAVKYKITATPGPVRSQQREPVRVDGQEVRFFTPVRRSVRIERASLCYPAFLREHDLCVASYNDLPAEEECKGAREHEVREESPSACTTPMYVYRENEALKDQVRLQLVYEDD